MKSLKSRAGAVALALVIGLSIGPSSAAGPLFRDFDNVRDPIVRVIKKIRNIFGGGVSIQEDLPQPPRP